ncbi:MAG: glucosamine--fructose-6-phosphate aminotransferase, partial [Akkermansiaceae bacterium]|nr:glucosamine--fructose-6-phosphate aminotransferase [Akkermansiaceae bacterium]
SPADFLHGPIALLDRGFPAVLIAPSGRTLKNLLEFANELRKKDAATLIISDDDQAL